jgi:hypothetical protein
MWICLNLTISITIHYKFVISDAPVVTSPGQLPPVVADNYKDMFSFIRVN